MAGKLGLTETENKRPENGRTMKIPLKSLLLKCIVPAIILRVAYWVLPPEDRVAGLTGATTSQGSIQIVLMMMISSTHIVGLLLVLLAVELLPSCW